MLYCLTRRDGPANHVMTATDAVYSTDISHPNIYALSDVNGNRHERNTGGTLTGIVVHQSMQIKVDDVSSAT